MKQYIYLLLGVFLPLTFTGCDYNDRQLFNTDYTALDIWFGSTSTVVDSTIYNYSYTLEVDSLTFYAQVTGLLSDEDRTFVLEVFDGDIEEAEGSYTTLTYTMPAGEYLIECPIYFDTSKLKDSDSFSETDGHLYFRMAENSYYNTGTEERSVLHVVLRNRLSQPEEWYSATYPYRAYYLYFGEYSQVKYQFMIQILGLIDFHILYTATVPYDEDTNTVSVSYVNYMVELMQQALIEYNATHDTPLTDETGTLVTF